MPMAMYGDERDDSCLIVYRKKWVINKQLYIWNRLVYVDA
jgi:hypothetical protein